MGAFTIELKRLGRLLRRGLQDEHWNEFYRWKWLQLGQRFIKLNLGQWFPDLGV